MVSFNDHASTSFNKLLASLPAHEMELLRPYLVRVPLVRDQMLAEHGQPVDHAFFIERGVVSVISEPVDDEDGIQVAMIGREGMVGDLALVDVRHSACARVVVHIPGTALRVAGGDLRRAMESSPALFAACARFVHLLMAQVMQTAACNARRSIAERCARWLVMTHEALSSMLGMRRSGVTVAAAALQQAGLIRTGRGRFVVVDLPGLHSVAQGIAAVQQPAPRRISLDRVSRLKQDVGVEAVF